MGHEGTRARIVDRCAAQTTNCFPTRPCGLLPLVVAPPEVGASNTFRPSSPLPPCALQDMKGRLQRARNLQVLLECPSACMAVALASSSLPKAALELAQQLERSDDAKAAQKVRLSRGGRSGALPT